MKALIFVVNFYQITCVDTQLSLTRVPSYVDVYQNDLQGMFLVE